ncbi:hypothetical protein AAHC03_010257 [Spirometra sp. Aus1]
MVPSYLAIGRRTTARRILHQTRAYYERRRSRAQQQSRETNLQINSPPNIVEVRSLCPDATAIGGTSASGCSLDVPYPKSSSSKMEAPLSCDSLLLDILRPDVPRMRIKEYPCADVPRSSGAATRQDCAIKQTESPETGLHYESTVCGFCPKQIDLGNDRKYTLPSFNSIHSAQILHVGSKNASETKVPAQPEPKHTLQQWVANPAEHRCSETKGCSIQSSLLDLRYLQLNPRTPDKTLHTSTGGADFSYFYLLQ